MAGLVALPVSDRLVFHIKKLNAVGTEAEMPRHVSLVYGTCTRSKARVAENLVREEDAKQEYRNTNTRLSTGFNASFFMLNSHELTELGKEDSASRHLENAACRNCMWYLDTESLKCVGTAGSQQVNIAFVCQQIVLVEFKTSLSACRVIGGSRSESLKPSPAAYGGISRV